MGEPPFRITRLVAESRRSSPALAAWVERVRVEAALRDDPRTLYEAAVEASGIGDPDPPDLGPDDPAAARGAPERAYAVLRLHFGRLLAAEPAARLGEDPLATKRMRVAIARMRTAMHLWEDLLPKRIRKREKAFRRIARRLGRVRDLDLQIEELERRAGPVAARDGGPGARWASDTTATLARRRREARAALLAHLDAPETRRLLRRFGRALRRGPRKRRASGDALAVVAPAILAWMRRLRREGDALGPDSPAAAWHRLRRRGKRLRYAVEFHADRLGEPGRDLVRALVALQDRLGAHQDAEVSLDRLRALREDRPGGADAHRELLDAWAEDETRRVAELRAGFSRTWERLRGRRWKRLARTLRRA